MGLLKKFQNEDRGALTQTYRDLCSSIVEAFEGDRGRYDDAERFTLKLNGLTSVSAWLYVNQNKISVSISGSIGLSYEEREKIEKAKNKDKALAKAVSKIIKLDSKWAMSMGGYGYVSFSQDVSTKLSDSFLSDLVKIMEKSGFVPCRGGRAAYF